MAKQVARIGAAGLLGVTMEPAFFGLDIDARALYAVYARAEELGLIVCMHTGITYSRMHPLRHERPELLDQVACDFPELRLVACHAGWPWATEFAAVARRHPTVYLEFGALAPKYVARPGTGWDAMFGMMPNVLRGQVLYGSDWPMMAPERALREWRESGLDDRALQALFHDNAADLFGLRSADDDHAMLAAAAASRPDSYSCGPIEGELTYGETEARVQRRRRRPGSHGHRSGRHGHADHA